MEGASILINSSCYLVSCKLVDNSMVIDSSISPRPENLEETSTTYSPLSFSISLGTNALIKNSIIRGEKSSTNTTERMNLKDRSAITDSAISGLSFLQMDAQSSLESMTLSFNSFAANAAPSLEVGERSHFRNGTGDGMVLPNGSPKPIVLSVPADRTLDWMDKLVCGSTSPLMILRTSLTLDTPSSFDSVCKSSF